MNSAAKAKTWGIIAAVSAVIWAIFLIGLVPDPPPLDEQIEAFALTARADDQWHNAARLHRFGYLDEAEKLYDEALITKPEHTTLLLLRGKLEFDREQYENAIGYYNKALDVKPGFSWALNARAIAKYRMGDREGAMVDLDQAIKLDPDYAGSLLNKSVIYRLEGDLDTALEYWKKSDAVIPGVPTDRASLENLAEIHFELRNFEESKIALDSLLQHHPDYYLAYKHRAKVYRAMGEMDLAQRDDSAFVQARKAFEAELADLIHPK